MMLLHPLSTASTEDRERLLNHRFPLFSRPAAAITRVDGHPSAHMGLYLLVMGKKISEVLDGNSNTLLIDELQPFFGAPWVLGPTGCEDFIGSDHGKGSNFAMLDGSVHLFATDTNKRLLQSLLTPAGREIVNLASIK